MGQKGGPLDEAGAGRQAALARRWRHLRDGAPSALYLLAWAVAVILVGTAVGMLLTKLPSHQALSRADAGVDRWLAAHRTRDWNTTTHLVTSAAETVTITVLAVLTFAGAALAWRRWREPMLVAAAVIGEVVIFVVITLLVDRPRPPVPHLDPAPPTSSFPSGHTAAAAALYGSWAVLAWQRARSALPRVLLTLLAVLAPVVVGLARMYRGMHVPTDVLAGAALGVSWLGVSVRAVRLGVLHHGLRAQPGAARGRRPLLRHG
ncbi:MAG TPA: phosphatase PAP2 family protein [Actinomycetes bacterium]|jgi:undecaprenyl-diphosphatase|nr:phosphatase PAP2 family protein [Actinomycetes bacterium]